MLYVLSLKDTYCMILELELYAFLEQAKIIHAKKPETLAASLYR